MGRHRTGGNGCIFRRLPRLSARDSTARRARSSKEEFLDPLHITNYRLAKTIGVSETSIGEIVRGKRRISVPMAARLAKAFSMTPEFWINLQTDYDLLTFDSGNIEGIKPLVTA